MNDIPDFISDLCSHVPVEQRGEVQTILNDYFEVGKLPPKTVGKKYAYRWGDLLSLEDLFTDGPAIATSGAPGGIAALVKVWIKHRSDRVKLSRDEALVLRQIKASKGKLRLLDLESLLEGKIGAKEVGNCLSALTARKDAKDRFVVQYDPSTKTYSTDF